MLDYKIVGAKDRDMEILTSIKLVTMIDDEMDKVLSYTEKTKIKKNIYKNIERNCDEYNIIYVDKKIAGAYLVIPYKEGYIIDELYLFKEYRNQGIGTSIINKIKKEFNHLYIWVYKKNRDAIRFLERHGFFVVSDGRSMIMKCDHVYCNVKDKLQNIKLGYRDKEGNKYIGYHQDFKNNFYLQSPKQLLESNIGTCFDQVELLRELVSKLDVDLRTYFIQYPDEKLDISHVFLIYKDSCKYYWIENAWVKYRGLHIYDTKRELFDDVLHKFVDTIPGGDFKKVKLYLFEKPRYGINYAKYLSNCINGQGIKVK